MAKEEIGGFKIWMDDFWKNGEWLKFNYMLYYWNKMMLIWGNLFLLLKYVYIMSEVDR